MQRHGDLHVKTEKRRGLCAACASVIVASFRMFFNLKEIFAYAYCSLHQLCMLLLLFLPYRNPSSWTA